MSPFVLTSGKNFVCNFWKPSNALLSCLLYYSKFDRRLFPGLADLGPCGLGFSFSPKKFASFVFLLLSFLFYFFSFADLRFITCVSATLQF